MSVCTGGGPGMMEAANEGASSVAGASTLTFLHRSPLFQCGAISAFESRLISKINPWMSSMSSWCILIQDAGAHVAECGVGDVCWSHHLGR